MKDFIVIDWCVADICNMSCEYCISSGIKKNESTYRIPDKKTVIGIANRIKELSGYVKKLTLNLCGGEPLLAENIAEAVEVLSEASNIDLVLITNFKHIDKVEAQLSKFRDVFISLHIRYRTEEEVSSMINKINKFRLNTNISLSQVDYELTDPDISKLALINFRTEKSITFLTYNIPISVGQRKGISKHNHFKSPYGKCCLAGNMFFNISSDGMLLYDLWCRKAKESGKIYFLNPINEILEIINTRKYFICPFQYCPCNYNVIFYEKYLSAMKKFDLDNPVLFKRETRKKKAILQSQVNTLKIENKLKQLESNSLKEKLTATELSFEKLTKEYVGIRRTWSWKIGYFSTQSVKFLFGWTPFVRNYLKNKNEESKNG